jgi:uncharacterized membrane protein
MLNMLWLAAIVFLPFPTSLIENGLDGGFGSLYISTLLVICVLNLILANYLAVTPNSPMARQRLKAANMSWQISSQLAHSWSRW